MTNIFYMLLCTLVMAGVTYLIRVAPFLLFQKKISNIYIRSFLYYVPYAVLSSMIFPAAIYATGSVYSGIASLIVAFVLAFFRKSLLTVALAAAGTAFFVERVLFWLGIMPY